MQGLLNTSYASVLAPLCFLASLIGAAPLRNARSCIRCLFRHCAQLTWVPRMHRCDACGPPHQENWQGQHHCAPAVCPDRRRVRLPPALFWLSPTFLACEACMPVTLGGFAAPCRTVLTAGFGGVRAYNNIKNGGQIGFKPFCSE